MKIIKKLVKLLLKKSGYGVFSLESNEFVNFDNILFALIRCLGSIKYLQIGANDGVFVDPMFKFVEQNHHKMFGLLIEPVPSYFEKLNHNYRKFPTIRTLNCAVHNVEKEMTIYTAKPEAMNWTKGDIRGMSSFYKDHLVNPGFLSESEVSEIQVKCVDIYTVLLEQGMLDINLLVIDTEGYDFQILKEIDLDKISPKVIHFEHGVYSQTMSLSEISIVIARLNSHGYQVMLDNNDGIAVKTDFLIEFVLAKKVS